MSLTKYKMGSLSDKHDAQVAKPVAKPESKIKKIVKKVLAKKK